MPFGVGAYPASRLDYWPMAGLAAGVVTEGDVNGLPGPPTRLSMSLQNPATWTYLWVALAFAYLIGVYLGMIRISRK